MSDTDSIKSLDFLLNPVCIMVMYIITVLLCKYLRIEMKFKLNRFWFIAFLVKMLLIITNLVNNY